MNTPDPASFNRLKEAIFQEYDRLKEEDTFRFGCHPGVPCFNLCCTDVNIFLSPYDILRMKNRLGITSQEFLDRYTLMPMDAKQHYPVVLLKMLDDEALSCPFVEKDVGCTIYEDRPWPCRMFPVGKASPKMEEAKPFYFLMHEEVCKGWDEPTEWTVRGWIEDQQVQPFDEWGERWKELTLHDFFGEGGKLTPPQMEMFHMVCYNLDKFRAFVFESSFLDRFEVEPDRVERMRAGDEALLEFGFEWLRFALFREPVIKVREEAIEEVKKRTGAPPK